MPMSQISIINIVLFLQLIITVHKMNERERAGDGEEDKDEKAQNDTLHLHSTLDSFQCYIYSIR